MKVVSNASPLIALSMIDQFGILKELFGKIYIPEAVFQDIVVKGKDKPGSDETKNAITNR
ncbi:MAG: hypothetical protein AB1397_07730 [bacterium]